MDKCAICSPAGQHGDLSTFNAFMHNKNQLFIDDLGAVQASAVVARLARRARMAGSTHVVCACVLLSLFLSFLLICRRPSGRRSTRRVTCVMSPASRGGAAAAAQSPLDADGVAYMRRRSYDATGAAIAHLAIEVAGRLVEVTDTPSRSGDDDASCSLDRRSVGSVGSRPLNRSRTPSDC